jgi:transcriptional regulator with XRE-family HTH domain
MSKSKFSDRLREVRQRRGLTATALSQRAGLHITAISLLEGDKRLPGFETMVALAKALNVSADFLLGLSKEMRGLG